ncbi:MAG: hypothetical protein ACLUUO_17865 [Sellimonas intestinalis]
MSKMSRQERLAYEQALKKRKKQGSSTKKKKFQQLPQHDEDRQADVPGVGIPITMAMRSMRMIFVIAEAVVISIMTAMTAVAPMIHTMIMTITIRMDMMTIMITMMMIMNMRSGQADPDAGRSRIWYP